MSANNHIYKNDIGSTIELTIIDNGIIYDVSLATTKQIILKKPSGAVLTKTALFSSDGSDGKIYYIIVSGDLDEAGTYDVQAKLILPTGTWSSQMTQLVVKDTLL